MLIRHLDFFITLAEERHFGRAAELCGVSQPALSQAIRKLEEDLGSPLILRGQRFMGLTPEGEKVLGWGRQILSDYGSLRADLSGRRRGGLNGELRLGVSASALPMLPDFCAVFEQRNPLARLRISELSQPEIEAGLTDFSLDGGFGWLPARRAKSAPVQHLVLWRQSVVFACPADHPFASGEGISLQDALTQPLCLAGDLPQMPGRSTISCGGLGGVLAHLRSGRWCSLVPEGFARLLAPVDDICLVSLSDAPPPAEMGALVMRRQPQSPMVQAFEEALAAFASAHPPEAAGPKACSTPGDMR